MTRDEAVQKLATAGRLSIAHAEDLYDSFFEKPVVPQYVADWYEEHKDEFYLNLHRVVRDFFEHLNDYCFNENPIDYSDYYFACWYYNTKNAIQTLVNMYQFGYEVEKEKRYRVILKGNSESPDYLVETITNGFRFYNNIYTDKREHTRKELEANGFGWVFNCDGIEVEEVGKDE